MSFARSVACPKSLLWQLMLLARLLIVTSVQPQSARSTPSSAYQSDQESVWFNYGLDQDNCQGDRIEAVEVGRPCSRRCRPDIPCENTRKQCLCDGICGLSCLKPELICAELPALENGDFRPKSTRFGTKVTFYCDPGFFLFGSKERVCRGDEEWTGIRAECNPEPICRGPVSVNHARNPDEGVYQLGDRVNYTCYQGYQPRGSSEAVCKLIQTNQTGWVWSGNPFKCEPRSCGTPGLVENGRRLGELTTVGSTIHYECLEGFVMNGPAKRYCQSDSRWSGQAPRCEPVTCNPTDHLENGKISYEHPLIFNSTVEYSCDYGFQLVGLNRRHCGPSGELVGQIPICREIDCGPLGPLENGHIRGYSSRMGDRKEFVCQEGMTFVGQYNHSVCLETGHWSNPMPKCLAPCAIPHVDHSTGVYVLPADLLQLLSQPDRHKLMVGQNISLLRAESGTLIPHGSSLEVTCEPDYELDEQIDLAGVIQGPICLNQTWSYEARCKPASCKSTPPSPYNGRVRTASMEHGSKGFFHCLDGFRLKGYPFTECIKGKWTKMNATCEEIYCGYPGSIMHGRVLIVGLTGSYDYKPYIRRISTNKQIAYECLSGYHTADGAPSGATCIDGVWRPEGLPTCISD